MIVRWVVLSIAAATVAGCSMLLTPVERDDDANEANAADTGPVPSTGEGPDGGLDDATLSGIEESLPAGSRQLDAGEILAVVLNNTLSHGPFDEFYSADGVVEGRIATGDRYQGRWTVDANNMVCTVLPTFNAEGCAMVYITPQDALLIVTADGRSTELTIQSGNQVADIG